MTVERTHTFGRLQRALHLARKGGVERLGPTQFRVKSRKKGEWYSVDLLGDPPCYCEDQEWAGRKIRNNCKHVLAAKILVQDPSIIEPLTEMLYQQQERNKELERQNGRKAS